MTEKVGSGWVVEFSGTYRVVFSEYGQLLTKNQAEGILKRIDAGDPSHIYKCHISEHGTLEDADRKLKALLQKDMDEYVQDFEQRSKERTEYAVEGGKWILIWLGMALVVKLLYSLRYS